jgi:cell division transport system permease protein
VLTKVLFVDKTLAGPIKAGIITGIDWGQIATTGAIITIGGVALAGVASYITLRLYVRL